MTNVDSVLHGVRGAMTNFIVRPGSLDKLVRPEEPHWRSVLTDPKYGIPIIGVDEGIRAIKMGVETGYGKLSPIQLKNMIRDEMSSVAQLAVDITAMTSVVAYESTRLMEYFYGF